MKSSLSLSLRLGPELVLGGCEGEPETYVLSNGAYWVKTYGYIINKCGI